MDALRQFRSSPSLQFLQTRAQCLSLPHSAHNFQPHMRTQMGKSSRSINTAFLSRRSSGSRPRTFHVQDPALLLPVWRVLCTILHRDLGGARAHWIQHHRVFGRQRASVPSITTPYKGHSNLCHPSVWSLPPKALWQYPRRRQRHPAGCHWFSCANGRITSYLQCPDHWLALPLLFSRRRIYFPGVCYGNQRKGLAFPLGVLGICSLGIITWTYPTVT